MSKVIANSNGKIITVNGKAFLAKDDGEHTYTGHVDTAGLTALGWDAEDIAWLQDHVWWDAEDDAYWAVTEANLAFGPNGATPLTWANKSSERTNPVLRYFPKLDPSPSSLTSWSYAFQGWAYLVAVPTHGWSTAFVNNMASMFMGDYVLRSIGDVSSWNVSAVTNMSYMFYNCMQIAHLGNLSGWDVSKVASMSNMFQECSMIRDLGNLDEWNISSVKSLASMFTGCAALTNIGDIGGWSTSLVTNMSGMFTNCLSLRNIGQLSNWDVSAVTNMSSMFSNCNLLSDLGNLSNWNVSAVTNMGTMFGYCRVGVDINTLKLNSWDVSNVTVFTYMFMALKNTYAIDVSGWNLESCTSNGAGTAASNSMFTQLTHLVILRLGPKFFAGAPTTYYFQDCSSWTRDSIYESLYTNQTLRDSSSTAVTVRLAGAAYDRLSQQDRDDIATKNITLMRG